MYKQAQHLFDQQVQPVQFFMHHVVESWNIMVKHQVKEFIYLRKFFFLYSVFKFLIHNTSAVECVQNMVSTS